MNTDTKPNLAMLVLAICLVGGLSGCFSRSGLSEFKERNKTNVAKVSTCFKIYASRNGKSPESQEQLVAFLSEERVAKNLERLGVDPNDLESIFVSDRDGEPLKIRWGVKWDPDMPIPVAFETVGVDGVRLVGADTVVEVSDDSEYEELWQGNYEPEWLKLKRGQKDLQ